MTALTERQKREREYYNVYAALYELEKGDDIDLAPVLGPLSGTERRPWNSYWAVYESALNCLPLGRRLLDFGSGPGENALRFSKLGFHVSGFDISEKNTQIAQSLFERNKARGAFVTSSAEELPYEKESFDVIVGIDILHHVDIPLSLRECRRVLRSGGKAIFREPVESFLFDWIRNTRLALAIAPKEASLELHITEDERKLNRNDEDEIRKVFPRMKKRYYCLFSRFDRFYREGSDPKPSLLERLDYLLIKAFPFLGKLCGAVIYELEKP